METLGKEEFVPMGGEEGQGDREMALNTIFTDGAPRVGEKAQRKQGGIVSGAQQATFLCVFNDSFMQQ